MIYVHGLEKFTTREKGSPYGEYLTTILEKYEAGEKNWPSLEKDRVRYQIKYTLPYYVPVITAISSFKSDKIPLQALNLLAKHVKMKTDKRANKGLEGHLEPSLSNKQSNSLEAFKCLI